MSRLFVLLSVLAMVAFTFGLSGCDTAQDTTPAEQGADGHDHSAEDADTHAGHDHGAEDADAHASHDDGDVDDGDVDNGDVDDGDVDDGEVEAALAELPEADQAAARAQKICPVSKSLLGSMGVPYKVTIGEKSVFLCCPGCEAELKANPAKYGL